jgi:hypothetical protein
MAKATRVHSTPRRTAPNIERPPRDPMDIAHSRLEPRICDCLHMAELAAMAIDQTLNDKNHPITDDEIATVMFAVYQLTVGVRTLHAPYYEGANARGKAVRA